MLFELLLNLAATIVLLMYLDTFRFTPGVAADPSVDLAEMRNSSPRLHAVLALLVLLGATVLAVYKPRGMAPYGRREQHRQRSQRARRTALAP